MAKPKKSAKPKSAKEAAPKKGRKETRANPGAGHNLAALGKAMEPLIEKYLKLNDAMESDMAGYASDFAKLYEAGANDLGLKKTVVTKELKRILANKKAAQKEKEMAEDERQQTEMWRAAAAGTQFALFAEGELAKPENGQATEDDLEEAAEVED